MQHFFKFGCFLVATSIASFEATATQITTDIGVLISESNSSDFLGAELTVDPNLISDVQFNISFAGDLDSVTENFGIFFDGDLIGVLCNNDATDDPFGIQFSGNAPDQCFGHEVQFNFATAIFPRDEIQSYFEDGALSLLVGKTADVSVGGPSNFAFGITGDFIYTVGEPQPDPIPAPATFAFLAAGLLGVPIAKRRGKKYRQK